MSIFWGIVLWFLCAVLAGCSAYFDQWDVQSLHWFCRVGAIFCGLGGLAVFLAGAER